MKKRHAIVTGVALLILALAYAAQTNNPIQRALTTGGVCAGALVIHPATPSDPLEAAYWSREHISVRPPACYISADGQIIEIAECNWHGQGYHLGPAPCDYGKIWAYQPPYAWRTFPAYQGQVPGLIYPTGRFSTPTPAITRTASKTATPAKTMTPTPECKTVTFADGTKITVCK